MMNFVLCAIPLVLCCPFFYVAGRSMVNKQKKEVKEGKIDLNKQKSLARTLIYSVFGGENAYDLMANEQLQEIFEYDLTDV